MAERAEQPVRSYGDETVVGCCSGRGQMSDKPEGALGMVQVGSDCTRLKGQPHLATPREEWAALISKHFSKLQQRAHQRGVAYGRSSKALPLAGRWRGAPESRATQLSGSGPIPAQYPHPEERTN